MSAQVLIPASARGITTTAASSAPLPSQTNLVASNCARAGADQRLQCDAAAEHAERRGRPSARRCRACSRRAFEPAPGAFCTTIRRVSRDVPGHVPRQDARIGVVAAAGAVADRQRPRFCRDRIRPHGLRLGGVFCRRRTQKEPPSITPSRESHRVAHSRAGSLYSPARNDKSKIRAASGPR